MHKYNSFKRNFANILACDFETTTDINNCYVWSAAIADVCRDKEVLIYPNINEFMNHLFNLKGETLIYFHNLKFDGSFILEYMYRETNYTCLTNDKSRGCQLKDMQAKTYQYCISDKGQWYTIQIRTRYALIEIRDSLKILPFALDKLTKDFDVEHKKTQMTYTDKKSLLDCTPDDITYIKNDVLGLAECLKIFIDRYGAQKNTIGSNCLQQYKTIIKKSKNLSVKEIFVKQEIFECSPHQQALMGCADFEQFIRKSYKGGFCYCNPKYQNKEVGAGYVLDVNSLYPAVMEGNHYPVGKPMFFEGSPLADNYLQNYCYYFIKILVNDCYLKPNKLPCVQIKRDLRFKGNEWLSKIECSEPVELVLTKTDLNLFLENYTIKYIKFVCGLAFDLSPDNIFKDYVEVFRSAKENATNKSDRTIAKLFLNNLYGKMSSKRDTNYKIIVHTPDGWRYDNINNPDKKKSVNIAIGSAITSYARDYIIRSAQHNINNFCYADTDSLHCIGGILDIKPYISIDDNKFGAFKLENTFLKAKFIRQKTYAEIDENNNILLTGCGMNKTAKDLMMDKIKKGGLAEFRHNVVLPKAKLLIKCVKGGTVLVNTDFTLR